MNIKDVAKLAGVSPATVSRYINNTATISIETGKKIERVLELTQYKVTNKSEKIDFNHNPTVGLVVTSLSNPVYAEIVSGVQERARHFGLSTLIIETQYNKEHEKQAIIDLIRQRVEGVILTLSSNLNNEPLSMLKNFNFPFCLLHNESDIEPCVHVNNYQAGKDVASKLYNLGHRKFGMVMKQEDSSERAFARYQGFKAFMEENNLPEVSLLQVEQKKNEFFTNQQIDFIKTDDAPTAWFCSNDLLALKSIRAFEQVGLRIPENISVVGFDGMELSNLIARPLASVKLPNYEMGRIAVDMLRNSKAGAKMTNNLLIDYTLDFEGTVAAVS